METIIANSPSELERAYQLSIGSAFLGCDTETSGLDPKTGRLYSIQFSNGEFGVLIPLNDVIELGRFADVLADQAVTKIFHNARFDLDFLAAAGVAVNSVFDTMIAEKVLTRGAGQSVSLADTLYRYFAVDLDKSQRAKFGRKWDGIWTDELVDYALADVVHLPQLMSEQMTWLEKLGLVEEFDRQMVRILPANNANERE